MLRTFTCIMCPQGCEITAEGSEAPYSITGNKCKRGHEYVEQELAIFCRRRIVCGKSSC